MRRMLLAVALVCFSLSCARAEQVPVKYPQGTLHGYLAVRAADGQRIATGEIVQSIHGDRVYSRLIYRFLDGSVDDEDSVFSQRGTFRVITDRHVQKGPSFPHPLDMTINVPRNEVTMRYAKDGKPMVETTHLDLPDDLANGSILSVLTNLNPLGPPMKVSYVGATPKPRLVKLAITPAEDDPIHIGPLHEKARCFVIRIELGGFAGVVAPLVGKQPGDIRVWVAEGQAPAFIREEGAFYDDGPSWTVELASPVWGAGSASSR